MRESEEFPTETGGAGSTAADVRGQECGDRLAQAAATQ